MRRRAAALAILATATTGPAQAGWQGAEWNMTAAQVGRIAALRVEPIPASQQPQHRRGDLNAMFKVQYAAGEHTFTGTMLFDSGDRLRMVSLKLTDYRKCADLRASLGLKYGPPAIDRSARSGPSLEWHDASGGNVVRFAQLGEISLCQLQYSPLDRAGAKGL